MDFYHKVSCFNTFINYFDGKCTPAKLIVTINVFQSVYKYIFNQTS